YPVLLALGLPPLAANVTNTMALVFTSAGSVIGARPELAGQRGRALRLCAITAAGGAAGAAALLLAPASAFAVVVPVLIAGASVLLLLQPRLRRLSPRPADGQHSGGQHSGGQPRDGQPRDGQPRPRPSGRLLLAVFAAAVYIGYFGAAGGVVLLAVLSMMFAEPLIRVNALKNVVSGAANAVAAIAFALFAPVDWAVVPLLSAGFLLGGMAGPPLARRLPVTALRLLVAATGLAMAVRLGLSAYR
ncbi:MAG TPA: sulfite exporter TauE/SafE family protein, partial [Trebonia sp.]|nr:sulfite exporter TauE/SafE family protein [Trebonia sp.]